MGKPQFIDDFCWGGTLEFCKQVITKITKVFKISSVFQCNFIYLGLQLNQEEDCVKISQEIYAGSLEELDITDRDKERKLSVPEKESFQKPVGQLCWLANETCPDVAFKACEMSIAYKDAMVGDALRINKAIRKSNLIILQSNSVALIYQLCPLSYIAIHLKKSSKWSLTRRIYHFFCVKKMIIHHQFNGSQERLSVSLKVHLLQNVFPYKKQQKQHCLFKRQYSLR